MPLNKSLFEKNIAGNSAAAAGGNNSGSSSVGGAPRRKWGKQKSLGEDSTDSTADAPKKPKWGGSHLKKTKSFDSSPTPSSPKKKPGSGLRKTKTNEGIVSSPKSSRETVKLKKTPTSKKETPTSTQETVNLKKVPIEEANPIPSDSDGAYGSASDEVEKLVQKTPDSDINSTVTDSTADMTEKLEASGEINGKHTAEEPAHDWAAAAANATPSKKEKKSKRKKGDKGSAFALDKVKEVPPEKRTKGKFDWSGVDSVIASINFDKKIDKKRQKLQEKLENINATREDALKMMRDHVQEQKGKMDESKGKVRKKMYEATSGMSHTEMVAKVKENNEIVAHLKKDNNKLRTDTTKLMTQVRNLRVNNMKLEAANEQSNNVLEQLKERKKAVDSRYEHLTKVIIPPYQERIKEMQEVVEERKLYGRNEHRTKVRYGNYIIRFLDKVDRSDEREALKETIWYMGQDVEGGDLAALEDDEDSDDDDMGIEDVPIPTGMNESFSVGDMADGKANGEDESTASASADKEDKSLWDRYGSSKSGEMNSSKSGDMAGGKHADLLQKANKAKANNFNGAVILSDSSSSGSDSDDSDSDSESGSDSEGSESS